MFILHITKQAGPASLKLFNLAEQSAAG